MHHDKEQRVLTDFNDFVNIGGMFRNLLCKTKLTKTRRAKEKDYYNHNFADMQLFASKKPVAIIGEEGWKATDRTAPLSPSTPHSRVATQVADSYCGC